MVQQSTPSPDAAAEAQRLVGDLLTIREGITRDPLRNPVRELSYQLSRALEGGELTLDRIEGLIDFLDKEAFARRCDRAHRYLASGHEGPEEDPFGGVVAALSASLPDWDAFEGFWSRRHETVVFTGHPTFLLSVEARHRLADLAHQGAVPVTGAGLPDSPITLNAEHAQAKEAMENAADSIGRLHRAILEVAKERFPDQWTNLVPSGIGTATWVGYDMDGRTDIGWQDVIRHRLEEKAQRLRRYWRAAEKLGPGAAQIAATLKEGLVAAERHAAAFGEDLGTPEALAKAANALTGDDAGNLTSLSGLIEALSALLASAPQDQAVDVAVLRAEMATAGLGMGDVHFRLNAAQIRHAAKSILDLSSEDDLFGRSALDTLSERIVSVEPVTVNFASLAAEEASSARLFIAMAQILKHVDADRPIRLLIAECENPVTVLTAIYEARRFGVADMIDVCPLFETALSLERGRRILDVLFQQPAYCEQARLRGRVSIETGFSDAGRFMGQIPAGLAIERLQGQLAEEMDARGLGDLEAVIFDTHGESMGRGGHPGGIVDRCLYALSPWARNRFARRGIALRHEQSFQGGDGYLWFTHKRLADLTIAGILGARIEAKKADPESDPFYRDTSASLDFFNTVKRRQEALFRDGAYNLALGTIGLPLLPQTGSRKSRRQFERAADEETSLRRIRAIPHNAMLQQLGFLANILGGVGNAVSVEPEAFARLHQGSDRFARLMRLVDRARAGSDMKTFLAYIFLYSGSFWATRPITGQEPALDDACATLAQHLSADPRYFAGTQLAASLRSDAIALVKALDDMGFEGNSLSAHTDPVLDLLHALRLTLLQHAFLAAAALPPHTPSGAFSREEVLDRVLAIDFDGAREVLARQDGSTASAFLAAPVEEPASYPGTDGRAEPGPKWQQIGDLDRVRGLLARISVGVANHFGAIG